MNCLRLSRLLLLLLLCSTAALAQQKTVTGKILDTDGKGLPGVNIGIKGSTTIVATDANGAFTITVPSDQSVLKISTVGFIYQEITIGARTSLEIKMQKANKDLDEVVVIGYGSQKARNITGSIVSVDTKKLEDLPVATVTEMLRGQVPNLSVSGGSTRPGILPTLSIRQQFNWGKDGGSPSPIIIIDDVIQVDPTNNYLPSVEKLNALDLSEVESITVIRDGSAAIYGARGSQGAIVVKTKRGKAGPPRITYSGKFETNDAVSHGKVMNAKEYGIFANRFNRQFQTSADYFFSPTELASMDSLNYDWLHDWRSAQAMQHTINVSGGADRATYFVGGSYYTQGANLGTNDYDRWSFRAGSDVKVASGFKLGANISAYNTSLNKSFTKINVTDGYATTGEQNDYAILLHMPKYIPWQYNINGVDQFISPVLGPNKTGQASGNGSLSMLNYYALLDNGSTTNLKNFSYTGNFSLQYDVPFVKGLSFRGNYAVSSTAGNTEQIMMPVTFYQIASTKNKAESHLFNATNGFSGPVAQKTNSRVTYDNTTATTEQLNFFATYDRSFGNHTISALFSGERQKNTYDDRLEVYDNPLPGAYNGTSISAGTLNTGNSFTSRSINGSMSYIGRLNYNFKNKYLLQFVFRNDASSKVAPQNYWGFFPGVSAGWVISEEEFFKRSVSWVNFLKIRASVARTGNDNIKPWKWMQTYAAATDRGIGFGANGGNFATGLTPDAAPNPNVNWDRTLQRNLGIDVTLLRNRLSITLDGYYNTSKDLLTIMTSALNAPISVGGAFAEQNYGNVNAWGTEIAATWSDHIGKVNYSVGMNFAINDNKVTKYLTQPFNYPSKLVANGVQQEGYSLIGPIWGYQTWKQTSGGDGILRTDGDIDAYWAYLTDLATKAGTTPKYNAGGAAVTTKTGLKKGMLAYQDKAGTLDAVNKVIPGQNGQINDDEDYVKLANGQSYGIVTNLSVSWKSLSLLAQIATTWGGYNSIDRVKQGTSSTNAMWSQAAYLNDMYDSTDNPNGKYPNIYYYDNAYKQSDFWTISSFRCVVRSLSVGYSLPKQWMDKVHMQSARLVLSGYNLWDLYNPYPGKYRNMYDGAITNYPTLRTWALGVNVGF